MARGLVYGGLRIGLYSPIKTWMAGDGKKVSMQTKMVAGCASGALAAGITNPIELVRFLVPLFKLWVPTELVNRL